MKILFLVPYPLGEAPSQRFRFEQYFKILSNRGISCRTQSFLNSQNWQNTYRNGNLFKKISAVISGFLRRFYVLLEVPGYDFVFIHREAAPIGPPLIEWLIGKVMRKKIIYDFDDAIWASDNGKEGALEKIIRWRRKVKNICKWSYKVSCGNEYLCHYVRQFNSNVILNPTTIDTQHLHNPVLHKKEENSQKLVIGWTGSHSTLKYLNSIVPVIQSLEKKYPHLRFLVIANKKPELDICSLWFKPWSVASEIEDLTEIDIGIMPLPDDEWSKGKCGFKLLQYMALNIPAIAAPVGVNTKIIKQGENGFLCSSAEEWTSSIEHLIHHHELRLTMGQAGRSSVEKNYSVSSNSENFVSLFI